ncbi:MAG: hypothetical protein ACREFR_06050 [Limisphaerales bacterium]
MSYHIVSIDSPNCSLSCRDGQATESVAFYTREPAELDAIRPYWSGVDQASTLARGEFIAVNRESGGTLRGKMF